MNRIPLNYTQRQSLQPIRKDLEARIRDLKKQLRGQPHTGASYDAQSTLSRLKGQAHAVYTLIAGARGHEHAPKRTEKTLETLRTMERMYTTHFKDRRQPGTLEALGLLLKQVETAAPTAQASAA
jgi:hypothetical protein